MVVVRMVAASREHVSEGGQLIWQTQKMSCPAEILPDEEVFHRSESCPLKNFYVCHVVLPSDLHD